MIGIDVLCIFYICLRDKKSKSNLGVYTYMYVSIAQSCQNINICGENIKKGVTVSLYCTFFIFTDMKNTNNSIFYILFLKL